jgi:hypothetical protein
MMTHSSQDVTQLLQAWSDGFPEALVKLTPLVHQQLHRLARVSCGRQLPAHLFVEAAIFVWPGTSGPTDIMQLNNLSGLKGITTPE